MLSMLTLLIAVLTVVVLMFLHEGAHYLSAKTMDLRVIGYGFKTERRVPYPYVEVGWTPNARNRRIYLRRMAAGAGKPAGDDAEANSHLFTPEWYLHFTLWIGLVIVLLSPRFLLGVVMQ